MPESDAETVVLLSTCPLEKAASIARELVDARLAACVNVIERVTSFYRWEGKLCEDPESLLVVKTTRERVGELIRKVVEVHPYSVPEVVALPIVAGHEAYLRWVTEETGGGEKA